jgi:hypothetical protein
MLNTWDIGDEMFYLNRIAAINVTDGVLKIISSGSTRLDAGIVNTDSPMFEFVLSHRVSSTSVHWPAVTSEGLNRGYQGACYVGGIIACLNIDWLICFQVWAEQNSRIEQCRLEQDYK